MMEKAHAYGDLRQRLDALRERIDECGRRSGRSADEITLVAVSKTHPADSVREAIAAGVADFGENRVQEAEGKIPEVGRDQARWHLIGHLQSNKARRAVELFDVIHSLDSTTLARRLNRMCIDLGAVKSKYDCVLGANLHPNFPVDRHIFVKRIRASGLTVLIVEQNVQQVLRVVDRAYLIEAGSIRASGTSAEIMRTDIVKQAYLGV